MSKSTNFPTGGTGMASFAGLFALSLNLLCASPAMATTELPSGFAVQPLISEYGVWDSNPLLATSDVQALYGSVTSPELIVSDNTPTKKLLFDQMLSQNEFNLPTYDSTDFHSKDSFTLQNQRWSLGADGQFDYDTTRTSEVTIFGFRAQPVRHWDLIMTPQASFRPLPTDQFGLSATASTSNYATSAFTDYEVFSVTPSYSHDFDPLNTGIFNVAAQRYQATQGPHNVTDTIGPSIGWKAELTPRLNALATVGVQWMRQYQSTVPTKPWSLDYIFTGNLNYVGTQDKSTLALSRTAQPFGNGTESLLTNFSLKDEHTLNKNFSLNVGAAYEMASYPTSTTNDLESLISANGGLTYHATEHVDITGSYQYRMEKLVNVSKSPDDHTVNFQLVYHPDAWTF